MFLVADNRPDNRSLQPQCLLFLYCQSVIMETPWSNPWALRKGQWLTYLDKKDTYSHRNPPILQMLHSFLSQWHSMAIHSSVIRSLNQPESIYKNTQTSISLFPSAWGQVTYVSGQLIVKPRVTSKHPGTGLCSRANILAKVPVPKARIGCKLIYIRCMPIILRWTLLRV